MNIQQVSETITIKCRETGYLVYGVVDEGAHYSKIDRIPGRSGMGLSTYPKKDWEPADTAHAINPSMVASL